MNRMRLAAMVLATATVGFASANFSDNFDTNTSSMYNVVQISYNGSATYTGTVPVDSKAYFNWDYSTPWPYDELTYTDAIAHQRAKAAIPDAPGTTTKRGLYTRVNENQNDTGIATPLNASLDSIMAMPRVRMIGDYEMTADLWFEVSLGAVSTQLGLFGIELDKNKGFTQGFGMPGYVLGFTGEGSSTLDYRVYVQSLAIGYNGAGSTWGGTNANGNNAYYSAAFPKPPFSVAGSPSGQWVTVKAVRSGGNVEFSIRNNDVTTNPTGAYTVVATVPSTAAVNGYVGLGMFDPASSPRPADQPEFCLWDNLQITGTNAKKVTGMVDFGPWLGNPIGSVKVECYDASNTLLETQTVSLDASGNYEMDVLPSMTRMRIKHSHWLGKSVDCSGSGADQSGVDFHLINGNVVSTDNTVDASDYFALSDAYETVTGDTAFNADADLNGDGTVDASDYFILSDAYELNGDE